MTMVNVFLAQGRAVILSDTVEYHVPNVEGAREATPIALGGPKVSVSRNGRFMVGGRGLSSISDEATAILGDVPDIHAAALFALALMERRWLPLVRPWNAQEVVLAGLDEDGSTVGYVVQVTRFDRKPHAIRLPMGATLRPSPGDMVRMPATWTDDQMVRAALWQCRGHLAFGLPMSVGGVIHMTEVTPAGGSQRIAAVSPDYDDLVCRLGAGPCAAEVDTWRAVRIAA